MLRALPINEEDFARIMGYKCNFDDCQIMIPAKHKLVEHINARHLKINPYKCDWPSCEYTAVNPSAMKRHIEVHKDIRPFACTWPGCEQKCRRKTHLDSHMITHGTERPFKCDWPQCDKRSVMAHDSLIFMSLILFVANPLLLTLASVQSRSAGLTE